MADARKEAYLAETALAGTLSQGQFELVYDCTSFGTAAMLASTLFFWLRLPFIADRYQSALVITGLVTFIAAYHYFRIFQSWVEAYKHPSVAECETYMLAHEGLPCPMTATGVPFNDAYRYMDWLLTVPLLLIEIVLVMKLSPAETARKATMFGFFSGLMIIFGYPGEMIPAGSANIGFRWLFWVVSTCPFLYVVYQLTRGLKSAVDDEEDADVRHKINLATRTTILSWLTYPVVYLLPCLGLSGPSAVVGVQIGYTISDIISKCGVGLLIYKVTYAKSCVEQGNEYKVGLRVFSYCCQAFAYGRSSTDPQASKYLRGL